MKWQGNWKGNKMKECSWKEDEVELVTSCLGADMDLSS